MRRGFILSAALIMMSMFSACNRMYLAKADKDFENLRYNAAIENYKKYLVKNDDPTVRMKVVEACIKSNHIKEAIDELSRIREQRSNSGNYWLLQGRLLMEQGKYDSAEVAFKRHLEQQPNDQEAGKLCENCSWISSMMHDTGNYEIRQINFDGLKTYFSASPYKNGIIFTANTDEKGRALDPKTGEAYLNLFYSEKDDRGVWLKPTMLQGDVNSYYHESCACVNPESEELFFTRSNSIDRKQLAKKDAGSQKIFLAKHENNSWKGLNPFPYNSEKYSVAQPSIAAGKKLFFFVSDMPGGAGGTDIYFSTMYGPGFTEPVNLGNLVNTAGNEMFPWYDEADSCLYFSSEGHQNFGGLDVFKVKFVDGKPGEVKNLGFPINSSKDDFNYLINKERSTGYISSNRSGSDKLYEVKVIPPAVTITGRITTNKKELEIEQAFIDIINKESGEKVRVLSDAKGRYTARINADSQYRIYAGKDSYFMSSPTEISGGGLNKNSEVNIDFDLEEIIIDKPMTLQNLYYGLNESELNAESKRELDKLAELLRNNPQIAVEVGSHTDARSEDSYNLELSEKRARAAVEYLINKGINKERISGKGYGETRLLNNCGNSVNCSDEQHALNRRTEFKVTRILNEPSSLK